VFHPASNNQAGFFDYTPFLPDKLALLSSVEEAFHRWSSSAVHAARQLSVLLVRDFFSGRKDSSNRDVGPSGPI
jgi:hypothetical protein